MLRIQVSLLKQNLGEIACTIESCYKTESFSSDELLRKIVD